MFPVALFFVFKAVFPEFSSAALLLALMPAGVSVAALCVVTGGSIVLGLTMTVLSSLLAPFVIPGVFALMGETLSLDIWGMFKALGFMVFVPVLLYFGFVRHVSFAKQWTKAQSKFLTVLLMGVMLTIVIAVQRDAFFENLEELVVCLALLVPLFVVFYAMGWFLFPQADQARKIAYALSSGAMNNIPGISLALLYFPPSTTLFLVLSEIPWVLAFPLFQMYLKKKA